MPPVPIFLPYYLGIPLCGGLAALVLVRIRRAEREGAAVTRPRAATVVLVSLVALTGLSAVLTVEEAVLASTWVYHYYLGVETDTGVIGSIVLPVAADRALLAGLHAPEGSANWSFVNTNHGAGLHVDFGGPCVVEASDRLFAPFGSHPDPNLAPQVGSGSGAPGWGPIWIEYQGTGPVDVNFQYGSGFVINGAAVYIGPLKPGWNNYSMLPAP